MMEVDYESGLNTRETVDADQQLSPKVVTADVVSEHCSLVEDEINPETLIIQSAENQENESLSSKKEKYSCPLCSKEFQNKSGRYNHIRLHHKVKLEFGKVHCLETGCLFSCTYTTVLQQHLTTVHNIPMKYLNLEFDNYEEFEKWKHNFETGEVCRFVKKSGSRVGDAGKSMYLYCSRSGTFVSQGKGRRCKKLGTAKISAHCTALIKFFEESCGKVKATVCSTHYGHDRDHRFLRLTKVQKRLIAEKMKSGMSRELVLDSLRSSFVNKLDRIHELSKKDLNNIQKSYNIPRHASEHRKLGSGGGGGGGAAPFNPLSVMNDSWTRDIDVSVDSPVLLYKEAKVEVEHADLQPEDKCLVVMTRGQRDLFVKLCNNGVVYVSVLRLSATLALFLVVVFVLDDFYEMFPVCFAVANDNRAAVLKACFSQMMNAVGPVVVRAFATDDQPYIFDAWREVMGPASRCHIVANRHVDAEWRHHLTVIRDEALQGEVYDKLYDFIENDDGTERKLRQLIAQLRSSCATAAFAAYLERNLLPTIASWSTHYLRRLYDLREPVDFETSYSKIVNLSELCCKYNKSVGYAARGLIKLLLELQATRNRKVAEHVVEINNAHAASLESGTECVFPLTAASWHVTSVRMDRSDEPQRPDGVVGRARQQPFYLVTAEPCNFDDCVLRCVPCETCVHALRCACESYADAKTCVHVHLVGAARKNSATSACAGVAVNSELEPMLCSDGVDDRHELLAATDVDECAENGESADLRPLKVETLRALDHIGKKLGELRDPNSVSRVHALVADVRSFVDVILDHGALAKNVEFAKTSKPVKKKRRTPMPAKTKTKTTTTASKTVKRVASAVSPPERAMTTRQRQADAKT